MIDACLAQPWCARPQCDPNPNVNKYSIGRTLERPGSSGETRWCGLALHVHSDRSRCETVGGHRSARGCITSQCRSMQRSCRAGQQLRPGFKGCTGSPPITYPSPCLTETPHVPRMARNQNICSGWIAAVQVLITSPGDRTTSRAKGLASPRDSTHS